MADEDKVSEEASDEREVLNRRLCAFRRLRRRMLALYYRLLKLKNEGKESISEPIDDTLARTEAAMKERGMPIPNSGD